MDERNIIEEITRYYINPDLYPNSGKKELEVVIGQMDEALKSGKQNEIVEQLFNYYTSSDLSSAINETILKTRADEQGLSATRGYKEIYFNEIIQNANDNTTGHELDIIVSMDENEYELIFEYKDPGFTVSNIVGILNTEIHTKKKNLAATGKHGVGIKSLFYFVDYLKIESNVIIEFNITTGIEDNKEKILSFSSKVTKNENWDQKTRLTIKFPDKESYGEYNVGKLKEFVRFCVNQEVSDKLIEQCFFGVNQEQLIFDVRGLLFTDRNKDKEFGIKRIRFFKKEHESPIFELSCEENQRFKVDKQSVCKAQLKYNKQVKLNYLLFTLEGEDGEQNFSVAFPVGDELKVSFRRYYETYYLPEANEEGINFLINSKYSNVARTKLTDEDKKKEEIQIKITQNLVEIYKFMVSEQCKHFEQRKEISVLFHTLLEKEKDFIDFCYTHNINNRYVLKYNEDFEELTPYIVYKRNDKEEYEKRFVVQNFEKHQLINFVNHYILQEDTVKFDPRLFITQVFKVYEFAFNPNNYNYEKLRSVLNVAGTIRDLIYFRVVGVFPIKGNVKLTDKQVDEWNERIWKQLANVPNKQQVIMMSLSLLGRYKLHDYISLAGELNGASFYEYIFNGQSQEVTSSEEYPTFKNKQQQVFLKQYDDLKKALLSLRVNQEQSGKVSLKGYEKTYNKGEVPFYASWDNRAGKDTFYSKEKTSVYDYYTEKNLDSHSNYFGNENTKLFISKLIMEPQLLESIKIIEERPMITSAEYPVWGKPTNSYDRSYLLQTGVWFTCQLININFLRRLYAHSWDDFMIYFVFLREFFENTNLRPLWLNSNLIFQEGDLGNKKFLLSTEKDSEALFDLNVVDIDGLFQFFYKEQRINWFKGIGDYIKIKLKVNLTGEMKTNLCPEDYVKYLKELTGKEIYVTQTNVETKQGTHLLYWADGHFNILNEGNWVNIGTGERKKANEIIIVHDEKMDYKKAIRMTLEKLYGKSDILDRFNAFIPSHQSVSIYGEEYESINGHSSEGNSQSISNIHITYANKFNCEGLEKVILARGNNNNTCGCCWNQEFKSAVGKALIITENREPTTLEQYPQIIEVVCKDCEDILRKSHKETKLIVENNQFYVHYICDVRNTDQNKEVVFKHKICDGVRALSAR